MSITLDLPEELLSGAFKVPKADVPRQVIIELACSLYARKALAHGQAAALAGLDRFQMDEELSRREIPHHYTDADVKADLAYGGGQ